jgi:molybdopterin synthase sulfur carrier subunit
MALVHIPTPLRSLTAGASKVTVAGSSVREIVAALEAAYPGIQKRLVQDDRLRQGLAVFVDGANSRRRLRTKVAEDSEIFFVESIGGGREQMSMDAVFRRPNRVDSTRVPAHRQNRSHRHDGACDRSGEWQ